MGNTLYGCNNCSTVNSTAKPQPNQISPYFLERLGAFQELVPGIPYYENMNYTRLVNDLKSREEKFQDLIEPYEHLLNNPNIQWKRLSAVYPNQKFSRGKGDFYFQYNNAYKGKFSTYNLAKDLLQLRKFPDLILKMFANIEVSKEGFYVLYLALGGNIQKRVQIVIDDFVPVNSKGKYLFQQPRQGDGIWMILVQKAWAKLLKSYLQMQHFQPYHLFSQMTGVPKPELFNTRDFLTSVKYDFNPNQSKYIKITRDQPIQLLISIWTQSKDIYNMDSIDIIVEVIIQTENTQSKFELLPMSMSRSTNKIIFTDDKDKNRMLLLNKGQNIIHIYNKSRRSKQLNLVLHAKKPVSPNTRYQKQFQIAKDLMVQNQYKKIHHKIGTQYQFPGIQLRFCWMEHRGIFCLKNCSNQVKQIQFNIKTQYFNEIYFQDSGYQSKIGKLNPQNYAFFVVVRSQYREYGPFYEITVKKA